jgi:hypothetical protein
MLNPSDRHLEFVKRLLALACALVWIIASAASLVGQSSQSTAHWPTIRGPAWDGHAKDERLADHWPKEGPPVLWTHELGQGYSSFIAWDDCIATQYQTLAGQFVVCFDANTGTTKWQHRYDWPYDPASVYPGPRSTPTYGDGFVYFTSPSGSVGCLNAETGKLVWSIELTKLFDVRMPGFGYSCSPILVDDKIILPIGSSEVSFVALNRSDGSVRWKSADSQSLAHRNGLDGKESIASYCSIYPITFRGRKCVVGYLQNALVGCDSETGELIWRFALSSGYDEHSAWPVYNEPHLWITGAFQRGSELLELTDDLSRPVRSIRQSKLMSNDIFSSVLHDGALFGFDLHEAQAKTHRTSRGIFRCIDYRSGDELWSIGNGRIRRDTSSASDSVSSDLTDANNGRAGSSDAVQVGHTTVLVADGKLILLNDLGELILAKANRERYEELGRVSILGGEICWTQPAIAQGKLFVRNQSRAACLYLGLPELLPEASRAKAITVDQVPQAKFQDVASILLGVEPEYLFDLPSFAWLWNWYWVSMVVFMVSFGLAQLCRVVTRSIATRSMREGSARGTRIEAGDSDHQVLFWLLAFALGLIGTTVLSRWTGEFVFTWQVCLYVAWHVAFLNMSSRTVQRSKLSRFQSASALVFLLGTCFVYFTLCRRLSLVFEWVFLVGFIAALPFNFASKKCFVSGRWRAAWQFAMTSCGYTAYYWSSVAILFLRSG